MLICVAAVFAIPVLALVSTALKTLAQNTKIPAGVDPRPFVRDNFIQAVKIAPFLHMLANTVVIVGLRSSA